MIVPGVVNTVKFGAAKVFTTAGTDEKVKYLTDLTNGRVHAINYRTQNFEEEIKKIDEQGVDLIVDFVGPDYWNKVSLVLQIPAGLESKSSSRCMFSSVTEHLPHAPRRPNGHSRYLVRSQAPCRLGSDAHSLQTVKYQRIYA
jgi:hypothetical protein